MKCCLGVVGGEDEGEKEYKKLREKYEGVKD